jgi:predicted small lipoprotein YifL
MPGCNASKTQLKAAGKSFGRMIRMTGSRILVTLTLLTAMAAVTACGRKSGLDTPYEAAVQARKDAQKAEQPVPPEPEKPVEDKKFILDPLI